MSQKPEIGPEVVVELTPEEKRRAGIDWRFVSVAPVARKAPRVPRDNEPCRLWVFMTLVLFLVLCLAALGAGALHAVRVSVAAAMAYADAFFPALVRWVGDVLRWVFE